MNAPIPAHLQGWLKPYRPCPADFRERFLEMGWDGIAAHYRTNHRCIRRWIEESGGEELRAARRAVTGAGARPQLRSRPATPGAATTPPPPADFREVFERDGWRGVDRAYGAPTKTLMRWAEETFGRIPRGRL